MNDKTRNDKSDESYASHYIHLLDPRIMHSQKVAANTCDNAANQENTAFQHEAQG